MPQEWYRTFVDAIEREMLFELLTAANYMDIKPLLDLACLRVTFELSQKTAEEVSRSINHSITRRNGLEERWQYRNHFGGVAPLSHPHLRLFSLLLCWNN